MSNDIKFTNCKYCGMQDLHWTPENGRWVLNEPHGLPHVCEVRMATLKKEREEMQNHLKATYAAEKERVNAIPDNSPCDLCVKGILPGIHWNNSACPVYCRKCNGSGVITPQVKARMLYDMRKRLWPTMYNKGRK